MHLTVPITALLAAGASAGLVPQIFGGPANMDVDFKKYGNLKCEGDVLGDEHKIDRDTCKTMDHDFQAFAYNKHHQFLWPFHHNDYDTPTCGVAVFDQDDCKGRIVIYGPYTTTHDMCWPVPWVLDGTGVGRSATLVCDINLFDAKVLEEGELDTLKINKDQPAGGAPGGASGPMSLRPGMLPPGSFDKDVTPPGAPQPGAAPPGVPQPGAVPSGAAPLVPPGVPQAPVPHSATAGNVYVTKVVTDLPAPAEPTAAAPGGASGALPGQQN